MDCVEFIRVVTSIAKKHELYKPEISKGQCTRISHIVLNVAKKCGIHELSCGYCYVKEETEGNHTFLFYKMESSKIIIDLTLNQFFPVAHNLLVYPFMTNSPCYLYKNDLTENLCPIDDSLIDKTDPFYLDLIKEFKLSV